MGKYLIYDSGPWALTTDKTSLIVECVGPGGGGAEGLGHYGGGGGEYRCSLVPYTSDTTINVQVGQPSYFLDATTFVNHTPTVWSDTSTVVANAGEDWLGGGLGGSGGVGTIGFGGGNGGAGAGGGAGGSGGAGGPFGRGGDGGDATANGLASVVGGGGGGASGGGRGSDATIVVDASGFLIYYQGANGGSNYLGQGSGLGASFLVYPQPRDATQGTGGGGGGGGVGQGGGSGSSCLFCGSGAGFGGVGGRYGGGGSNVYIDATSTFTGAPGIIIVTEPGTDASGSFFPFIKF